MSVVHTVTFYPVGNGDTTQIVLANGRRILFDFCHRDKAEDPNTPEIDLKHVLRQELHQAKRDFFDVVAFTHADNDHIQGSTEFFELLHAQKYQDESRIKIRELWVPAAMLLEEVERDQRTAEFAILRQEARHRLLNGVGIKVFSQPQALMDWLEPELRKRHERTDSRDHLFVDAGTTVSGFDLTTDDVEFFCHSPFIAHCDEGDIIRNNASLVFNVRFTADGNIFDYLEVGDAEHGGLEDIVQITQDHGRDDRLNWDLFNIPHHCSYLALAGTGEKGVTETTPTEKVAQLLRHGQPGSYIVSCSKPMPDIPESYGSTQPPHIQARKAYERYLAEVGGRKFLVTMEEPNTQRPEPIVFEISGAGVARMRRPTGIAAMPSVRPPRAG